MPVSPFFTNRPSDFQVLNPATRVASGACEVPTEYACFDRQDPLSSSSAVRPDGDAGTEVFLLRTAARYKWLFRMEDSSLFLNGCSMKSSAVGSRWLNVPHWRSPLFWLYANWLIHNNSILPLQSSVVLEASSPGGAFFEPSTPESSSLGDSTEAGTSTSNRTALPRAAEPHASSSGDQHNSQQQGGGER